MKFKKLKLFTDSINSELNFYTKILGFRLVKQTDISFTIKAGWSELTFEKSNIKHMYHYCFLLPCNQLREALMWMENKGKILSIEKNRYVEHFESWNTDSFYFNDASGNLAEFIVRHNLENESDIGFSIDSIRGINEMGLPTRNIDKLNKQLEEELNTKFWKGDSHRFGTNGSEEGIWLLPNFEIKKNWFPTSLEIRPEQFEATIAVHDDIYNIAVSYTHLTLPTILRV